jgi:hypothetical protein
MSGQTADFYFYMAYGGGLTGDWNLLQSHHRYVFFLMWDRGVLRAVRDFWRTSVEATSGRHRDLPLSSDKPLEERIAVLLLTPGVDLNPTRFSCGLLRASGFSRRLGQWRTVKLLKELLTNPNRAVRIGACEELTLNYMGQDECWNTLDVGDGSDLRYHHGVIAPQIRRKAYYYHARETQDPDKWWEMASQRFSKADLLDELRLLTTDKDERVRKRFCDLLRTKFPCEADSGCGKPMGNCGT